VRLWVKSKKIQFCDKSVVKRKCSTFTQNHTFFMSKCTQTLEVPISTTKIAREICLFLLESSESPLCMRFKAECVREWEKVQMHESHAKWVRLESPAADVYCQVSSLVT
jgi:hypothetical protein